MILGAHGKAMQRNVFLCVPSNGTMKTATAAYVMQMMATAGKANVNLTMYFTPGHTISDHSWNEAAEAFRRSKCGWFIKLDADVHPTKPLWPLLDLNLPVIGLPVPMFGATLDPPFAFCAWDMKGEQGEELHPHRPTTGLQKVDIVGGSCLIIRRDVLLHPNLQAPFMSVWNENGLRVMGNDMAFCGRCREAEFDVYTHYDYPAEHYTPVGLLAMIQAWSKTQSHQPVLTPGSSGD